MSGPVETRVVYEFGPFRVDPAESRLLRDGVAVPLTPKAFETLVALVSRAGRLVDKAELLREVWPDTAVEESSLSQHVYLVRKALGDERGEARCIETVPKRGYRFVAAVRMQPTAAGEVDAPAARVANAATPRARSFAWRPARAVLAAAGLAALFLAGYAWRQRVSTAAADAARLSQRTTTVAAGIGAGGRAATARHVSARPDAYDAYVRGLYFWNQRTAEGIREAARYFQDAVRRDPDYAAAHAGLADTLALSAVLRYGPLPPARAYEQARAAAQRALQLDDTLAAAHTALALVRAHADRDRREAEKEYRIALSLDPGSATALQRYARLLIEERRLGSAVDVTERALALDPMSPALSANLCYLLYLQRDYPRALRYCDKAVELQPNLVQAHTTRALIAAQQGRLEAALAELAAARPVASGTALVELLGAQGYAYARAGRAGDARVTLGELRALTREDDLERLGTLSIHAALGDADDAFDLLRSWARKWETQPFEVAFDPRYDGLHPDPRYAEIMDPRPPRAIGSEDALTGGAGERRALSTLF